MSGRSLVFPFSGPLAVALLAVSLYHPSTARGQRPDEPPVLPAGSERASSPFQLFAEADLARTGLRMSAEFSGCVDNSSNLTTANQCWNNFHPSPLFMPDWFDIFFYVAAPASERNKHAQVAPSLLNANNKGYTVNSVLSRFRGEVLPADGSLGPFHSGVSDSGAGDCTDHRVWVTGNVLLAGSDCEVTWGSLGWQGSRPVTPDGYLAFADRTGNMNFGFDGWRVPEDLHDADAFLGDSNRTASSPTTVSRRCSARRRYRRTTAWCRVASARRRARGGHWGCTSRSTSSPSATSTTFGTSRSSRLR